MKFKVYYYEDLNSCLITEEVAETPNFSEKKLDANSLVINIESKSVENIYDFFRNNTIRCILNGVVNGMEFDYSNIESESFFTETSFLKLRELFSALIKKSNDIIKECLSSNDEQTDIGNVTELVEELSDDVFET